ncbi:MAG TPA: tetratricopeptide repeat protein [Acidimicrobiia bacterium]|nr:tetratricopeptide repeat protein [Acidimicrobiia bacterium]
MADALQRGRDAIEAHQWQEAVDAFTAADAQAPLSAGDLHLLADASWWAGDYERAVDSFERAFGAYRSDQDPAHAAQMALWLGYISFRSRETTVGHSWLAQAEKLLAELPEEGTHAWLELLKGASALMVDNDITAGFGHIETALEVAERHDNTGAHCLAQSFKGLGLIYSGTWQEGLSFIDMAAAEAMAAGTDLRASSDVYCNTIAACRDVGDFRRAGEWTERAERWMQRQSVRGYPGICRVHRAELKRYHGSWDEAEFEARDACKELERFHLLDAVGFAHNEIGEIRRRRGDYAGAEESFMNAYEYGHMPQPGLALLMLARGEVEEAARTLERVLSQEVLDKMLPTKAVLLSAMARVALARGDVDTAREALATLQRLSGVYESPALTAATKTTAGMVGLESGDLEKAAAELDAAWRAWREIDFPYEMAEARCLLGKAYAARGDLTGARMEWTAAGATFQRLGAAPGMDEVDSLLREHGFGADASPSQRVIRTFMFTDIVTSTEMVEVIGDAAWDNIINWHDRTLRRIFSDHNGDEVKQTGDGFFVSFESAVDAVTAAVEVQRRLSRHRQDHGFAPWVRIGLHSSEATQVGDDYRGQGVHLAARVGGLGGRDEIVATASTVDGITVTGTTIGEPRPVELKGIAEAVQVVAVEWAQ